MSLKNTFRNAFRGLVYFLRSEANVKIHLVFTVLVILTGVFFNISTFEWIAILLCIGGVFATEAVNSAIEKICDLYTMEINPQIKRIKDLSAAGVLIMAIISVIIGLLVFLPYVIKFFETL